MKNLADYWKNRREGRLAPLAQIDLGEGEVPSLVAVCHGRIQPIEDIVEVAALCGETQALYVFNAYLRRCGFLLAETAVGVIAGVDYGPHRDELLWPHRCVVGDSLTQVPDVFDAGLLR